MGDLTKAEINQQTLSRFANIGQGQATLASSFNYTEPEFGNGLTLARSTLSQCSPINCPRKRILSAPTIHFTHQHTSHLYARTRAPLTNDGCIFHTAQAVISMSIDKSGIKISLSITSMLKEALCHKKIIRIRGITKPLGITYHSQSPC